MNDYGTEDLNVRWIGDLYALLRTVCAFLNVIFKYFGGISDMNIHIRVVIRHEKGGVYVKKNYLGKKRRSLARTEPLRLLSFFY